MVINKGWVTNVTSGGQKSRRNTMRIPWHSANCGLNGYKVRIGFWGE